MKIRSLKYLIGEGFKNIWLNRLMTLASVCVLVSCMLLMGVAVLLSINVDRAFGAIMNNNIALVSLEDEIEGERAAEVQALIAGVNNVEQTRIITGEEGVANFKERLGPELAALFEDDQFLPYRVEVTMTDQDRAGRTIRAIEEVEGVESVNFSEDLANRLVAIRDIIATAGAWMIGLLLLTALVIIANTIRITMTSRRLEITIMKAVGATNMFIRLPFVVEGMIFGLFSAAATTGILHLAYNSTAGRISEATFMTVIPYSEVVWQLFAGFCAVGILAGALGSMFTMGKYLKREGSELSEIL